MEHLVLYQSVKIVAVWGLSHTALWSVSGLTGCVRSLAVGSGRSIRTRRSGPSESARPSMSIRVRVCPSESAYPKQPTRVRPSESARAPTGGVTVILLLDGQGLVGRAEAGGTPSSEVRGACAGSCNPPSRPGAGPTSGRLGPGGGRSQSSPRSRPIRVSSSESAHSSLSL